MSSAVIERGSEAETGSFLVYDLPVRVLDGLNRIARANDQSRAALVRDLLCTVVERHPLGLDRDVGQAAPVA
jgi:hypothetical protein